MRGAALAALVAGLLLLTSGSATGASTATARWGNPIQAALPANAAAGAEQDIGITSTSCASAGNCSAVGSYVDDSGARQGLLLTETAGAWATGVELVRPSDAGTMKWQDIEPSQVSCDAAGDCSAVFTYLNTANNWEGLVVTETAGVWAAGVALPLPANAATHGCCYVSALWSVSCTTAGNCTAVGDYDDNSGVLQAVVWTETAGSWGTAVEASLPANAKAGGPNGRPLASLASVSCSSPGNCSAVGYYETSGRAEGLLETETAGTWKRGIEAKLPANAAAEKSWDGGGFLYAVSCSSTGNCSAVGDYCAIGKCEDLNASGPNGSGIQGLLLTETAGHWARGVEARLPTDAVAASPVEYLNSIACTSPGDCTTAGIYHDNNGYSPLLLTETAGRWAKGVRPALPANAHGIDPDGPGLAVSCVSPGNCAASGSYLTDSYGDKAQGLLLSQRDGVWAAGAAAARPANAHKGFRWASVIVSCTSIEDCTGVGSYEVTSGGTQVMLTAGSLRRSFMPNLVGETLRHSKRVIASHGRSLSGVRHVTSTSVEKGRVISQTPKPGTRLTLAVKIRLVVSTGRP